VFKKGILDMWRIPRHSPPAHIPFTRASIALSLVAGLASALVLGGCGALSAGGNTSDAPVTLNVFAAASLTEAFTEIQTKFQTAHANVTITYNFGGSDTLATQITQGAPADVFASANTKQMDVVVKAGQVTGASVQTFAHNRLAVIYPKANPAHLQTLQDLAKSGLRLDLAASTVPVGQYAIDFLTKASADPAFGASFKANVLHNVVSYETDVKIVLTKVSLGEADAGIVYTTDAATKSDSVGTIAIPDNLNSIAVYPIAPVKTSGHADVAAQFVAYVNATDGQKVLAKYGFLPGSSGLQYAPPAS
jgi:molybdate transport system substrate-binding protein